MLHRNSQNILTLPHLYYTRPVLRLQCSSPMVMTLPGAHRWSWHSEEPFQWPWWSHGSLPGQRLFRDGPLLIIEKFRKKCSSWEVTCSGGEYPEGMQMYYISAGSRNCGRKMLNKLHGGAFLNPRCLIRLTMTVLNQKVLRMPQSYINSGVETNDFSKEKWKFAHKVL